MLSKIPAFNLKAVLRETSLAADTLRAWERRYGLPKPQRTGGGHRLYSQYDIETIKWLMTRQREGLSISRAVDLWNEISASGADPLAGSAPLGLFNTPTETITSETTMGALRAEWIAACLNFNEIQAEQILNRAFSIFQIEDVCIEVIQKGLSEMGKLWYMNHASVQQEHFASGLAMRRIDALLGASPHPSRPQTILVGCPAGEWHTFTPLLVSLLLRRRGLNVIYLGANVPADRFAETAIKVNANLVILVAQTLVSAASLQNSVQALSSQGIKTAFGGRIFNLRPSIVDYVQGHFLGTTTENSIQEVEKLIKEKVKEKKTKTASEAHLAALHGFNSKRTLIEYAFKKNMQPLSISPEELNNGIHFLGNNIAAALQLGDMEHVSEEMDWLKTLLKAYNRPPQELSKFMQSYYAAIDEQINGQGDPIKKWLQEYSEK
jgi:MerR family transcriptional regulator, light-induced transcriptional regulator